MILNRLSMVELEIRNSISAEQNRLDAIDSIRKLLDQIDFNAEVLPENDTVKLINLLVDLKGEELNEDEAQLIEQLFRE